MSRRRDRRESALRRRRAGGFDRVAAENVQCLCDNPLGVEPGLGVHRLRLPCSMKMSGKTIERTSTPPSRRPCSGNVCSTCEPKPPIDPSSIVIRTSCSSARLKISSTSSGLAKRASATVVERPNFASSSAASNIPQGGRRRREARLCCPGEQFVLCRFRADADLRDRHANAVASRVTNRRRTIVDRGRCRNHMREFGFVRRSHEDEIREAAEIGDVERAGVRWPIGADKPGPIDRKAHRKRLNRDIVHDLIVGALQERRIDHAERLETFRRESRRERHRVLFGDANVEESVGNALPKISSPVPAGIAAVTATMRSSSALPRSGSLRKPWCKTALGLGLRLFSGRDVERCYGVIFVAGGLRGRIAFALLGHDMHRIGPLRASRTFLRIGSRWSRLWPSIGPT